MFIAMRRLRKTQKLRLNSGTNLEQMLGKGLVKAVRRFLNIGLKPCPGSGKARVMVLPR